MITQLVPGMFRHSSSSLAVAPLVDTHLWPCMHIHFGTGRNDWHPKTDGLVMCGQLNKRNMMKHESFSLWSQYVPVSFLGNILVIQRLLGVRMFDPHHFGCWICPLARSGTAYFSAPVARGWCATRGITAVYPQNRWIGIWILTNWTVSEVLMGNSSINGWLPLPCLITNNYILLLHYTTLHFSTTKA